jgi:hypothetical protein
MYDISQNNSFPLEALENRRASSLGRKMKNVLWTACVQLDADSPIHLKVKLNRKRR